MAQVYSFTDENGQTRLLAEIHPDPAGTPFNGGTITTPLNVAPTNPVASYFSRIKAPVGTYVEGTPFLEMTDEDGNQAVSFGAYANVLLNCPTGQGNSRLALAQRDSGGAAIEARTSAVSGRGVLSLVAIADTDPLLWIEKADGGTMLVVGPDNVIGMFGHAAAAQPVLTSGTATPEQIALALQSYGAVGGT